MRHGRQGHVAESREPTRRLGGIEVEQTRGRATRVHADAQVAPCGMRRGAGRCRAHGLVGPGYSITAVTHLRYAAPPFILTVSSFFFRVGLCSREIFLCRRRGNTVDVRCDRNEQRGIDHVDPSPRDHHQSTCAKGDLSERDQHLTL